MKVGDLVRCTWEQELGRLPGEAGVIVSAANDALGFHLEYTRYWEVMWTDGLQVVLNDDLEVINETR